MRTSSNSYSAGLKHRSWATGQCTCTCATGPLYKINVVSLLGETFGLVVHQWSRGLWNMTGVLDPALNASFMKRWRHKKTKRNIVSRYPAAGKCFQKTRYPAVRNFDQFSPNSSLNSSKNIRYLFRNLVRFRW